MTRTLAAGLCLTLLLPAAALAGGGPRNSKFPLSVKFEGTKSDVINLGTASGVPLSLRIKAGGSELGIGTMRFTYPPFGEKGFIVFEWDEVCHFWAPPGSTGSHPDCGVPEIFLGRNTFIEFTPDEDTHYRLDENGTDACTHAGGGGNPAVLAQVQPSFGSACPPPEDPDFECNGLVAYGPSNNKAEVALNRCVDAFGGVKDLACATDADCGSSRLTCQPVSGSDGLGICPNEDLPGLVLLADTGPGLVLEEDFTLSSPLAQRNLAGMLTHVGWEMDDQDGLTSIVADLVAYPGLLSPVIRADLCVGYDDPNTPFFDCMDPDIIEIDGGYRPSEPDSVFHPVVTLRAFVVNGPAPVVLTDEDGDGDVDSKDAEAAGYRVISSQDVIQLELFQEIVGCIGDCLTQLPNVLLFDYDGNGWAMNAAAAPGSPTTLTPVPR